MSVLVKKTQDELRTLVLEAVGRAVATASFRLSRYPILSWRCLRTGQTEITRQT